MKAIMVEDIIRVTSEPTPDAISIFSLKKGDIVETGKVIRKKKDSWVEVTTSSGQTGYISGQTRIFVIRQVELTGATDLLNTPSTDATVVKTLPKGGIISAVGVEKNDSGTWYHVTDDAGADGYISSRAKYRVYQVPTTSGATRLMITGAVFAAMGLIFFFTTSDLSSASSSLFLIIGLIGLGVFQMVQGYSQWRKAKQKTENK
jgi:hypothetical protein